MNDPKILLHRAWIIFDVMCALLAIYMALQNIVKFQEDESETTISYKKYGNAVEGKYPTFSMCFEGNGIIRFNESTIFAAYGIHLSDYEQMLDGKTAYQYEYNISSRRYSKQPLPINYTPRIDFTIQDLFQLPNLVKNANLMAENESQSIWFDGKESMLAGRVIEEPFYVSYLSSRLFCLTRKDAHTLDIIRRHDSVDLDLSILDSNAWFKILIHYPGQLFRNFDFPRHETAVSLDVYKTSLDFKVSQTTLLRKRSVKNDYCNKNIADHDQFLLESVTNDTGCVPPYWKSIILTQSGLVECRSPEQFEKVNDLMRDYKKIIKGREAPCLDMFTSVALIKNDRKICENEKCIHLEITYLEKYYEEILQVKAFSFQDFISALGGFIGIFLGYSLMQIPQLLGILLAF